MGTFIGRHAVAIFTASSVLLGLWFGAESLWEIHQYEVAGHTVSADKRGV